MSRLRSSWQRVKSNLKALVNNRNLWIEVTFGVNSNFKIQKCHDIVERMWNLSLNLESHNLGHSLRQVISLHLYFPVCNMKSIYPLFLFPGMLEIINRGNLWESAL